MSDCVLNPTIVGVGECLPPRLISNQELISMTGIESTTEWIQAHTGIESRFWANGELASDLAVVAGRQALRMSGVELNSVGALYLATTTPDHSSPNTASIVHGRIQMPEECLAVDLSAACAGGLMGLETATNRLRLNESEVALVIGSNVLSRMVNKQDRRSVILFGDGAGAAVLQNKVNAGPVYSAMLTLPNKEALWVPAGGMAEPMSDPDDPRRKIHMDGPAVKKHAIDIMTRAVERVAQKAELFDSAKGIDWSPIDYFIPHQANARLLEEVGEALQVPPEKCIVSVSKHGNTSSASILLALSEAYQSDQIKPGPCRIMFTAMGAGFVGGAVLMDVSLPEKA